MCQVSPATSFLTRPARWQMKIISRRRCEVSECAGRVSETDSISSFTNLSSILNDTWRPGCLSRAWRAENKKCGLNPERRRPQQLGRPQYRWREPVWQTPRSHLQTRAPAQPPWAPPAAPGESRFGTSQGAGPAPPQLLCLPDGIFRQQVEWESSLSASAPGHPHPRWAAQHACLSACCMPHTLPRTDSHEIGAW